MTKKDLYWRNKKLINLYLDFIPECTSRQDQMALILEIVRMHRQNEEIEKAEEEDLNIRLDSYYLEVRSLF